MTVEDIQYIGDNKYKITIGLTNTSTDTLYININNLIVSIQTNIIGSGGWIKASILKYIEPVESSHVIHKSFAKSDCLQCHRFDIPQELLLTPSEAKKKTILIMIPSGEDNNLFRTYEGDISLKVESEIILKRGSYNDIRMNKKMEEIYIWLRPGTNKWIYREGM